MKIAASQTLALLIPLACAGCTVPQSTPPYRPVATVDELMEGVVAHAAEVYWESVSTVIDESGINEIFPESDEEWEEVWAAALSLAEAGNLLLMPPRAVPDADWTRFSLALVDAGRVAADAALGRDPEAVLAAGEQVYNACLDCHERFVGL